ncbi:hypothetical protein GpartN1_g5111.t1 [Galdieria partita]|uniref:V-type proton ATPase subunit G n=1 Tax=Galdieria partita TaxID=83374 RepID=A0A9C7PZI4_9RHOD|nr:hypothetical protein GpartN1_g5111.t1 [Galdieria partita]
MTSGPETIKLLLKAEEEATSVVEQARRDRESRLKQATQEAQKEINAYRQEKEREYQEELNKHSGLSEENTKRLHLETEQFRERMRKNFDSKKDEVVQFLKELVLKVESFERE